MKHSMFLLILVMIFSPVLPAHQTAGGPDSQKTSTVMEIEKVREKMLEALNNHDFETMEKLYSEHYTWVSWRGTLRNKKERMALVRSGRLKYIHHREKDVRITVHDCVALVTGIATTKVIKDGRKFPPVTKRFTEIFILERGKWRKLVRQATKLDIGNLKLN